MTRPDQTRNLTSHTGPSVMVFQISGKKTAKKTSSTGPVLTDYDWFNTATCSPCKSLETEQKLKQIGQELSEISPKLSFMDRFQVVELSFGDISLNS